jgi:3'-5' exoribonuclease
MMELETLSEAIRMVGDKAHPWRGFLMVAERRLRTTKNGDPFLTLRLADAGAAVDAVLFADNPNFEKAADPAVTYVAVRGNLERNPRYGLQLSIADIRPVREEDRELGFDEALLTPSTPYDVDALWDELSGLAAEVGHEKLRETVQLLLKENEKAARSWPAAQRVHQAYRGGWLEHTVFVARDAEYFGRKYPELDADLLLAGAILHDAGKLLELDGEPCCEFTDEGRLVGHVVLGARMAREAGVKVGLDARTLLMLEHLILAHHGEREYGAAVLPKTREAVVLFHMDNIDAKLAIFRRHVEEDPEGGDWTGRAWEFGNQALWRGEGE